jgi:ketosteroid isomerase-like protein
MRRLIPHALISAAILLAALPAAAADADQTLQRMERNLVDLYKKGDLASIVQAYAPDAYIMPNLSPILRGREGARQIWEETQKDGVTNLRLEPLSREQLGPTHVRELGTFTAQMGNESVEGKYVAVWKKVGNEWLIDTNMWNRTK